MIKLLSLLVVLAYCVNANVIYSHQYPVVPVVDKNYVVVSNTNHLSGHTSQPVTIELRNPKCYQSACDYGARFTSVENLVFTYSTQRVTTTSCRRGSGYVVKLASSSISCDFKFCFTHGLGKATIHLFIS